MNCGAWKWSAFLVGVWFLGYGAYAQSNGDTALITGDNLRLRTQPSTDADVLTQLSLGTAATVVNPGVVGDWVAIQLADGRVGWVHTDFVTFTRAADDDDDKITYWFGDFAFALVSKIDDETFILHGHFDADLDVTIIDKGGQVMMKGKTGRSGRYSWPHDIHEEFNITELLLPNWMLDADAVFIGLVGNPDVFAMLALLPVSLISDESQRAESLAREALSEGSESFSANPMGFRFGDDHYFFVYCGLPTDHCEWPYYNWQYVVVMGDTAISIDTGCGGLAIPFRIGTQPFLHYRYAECESGGVGDVIQDLSNPRRFWANADYAT